MQEREKRIEFVEDKELTSRIRQKLWLELKPYQSRLASLQVYFVAYPWTVQDIVLPISAIQGGVMQFKKEDFRNSVLHAAERLANAAV